MVTAPQDGPRAARGLDTTLAQRRLFDRARDTALPGKEAAVINEMIRSLAWCRP